MTCRAALAGLALAAVAFALTRGTGLPATVSISSVSDGGCCLIFEDLGLPVDRIEIFNRGANVLFQESDGDRTVSTGVLGETRAGGAPANGLEDGGGDSLAIAASPALDSGALRGAHEPDDNAPDTVSSIAASEASPWTKLLIGFADLRARAFGGP